MTEHPPGTETCGCCSGTSARTPRAVWNRPGLPEVQYRSGTHADVLASLLAGLSSADRPALAALRTRDEDDLTIALLDAWAVTSDVLTFYTERIANESWLRTAVERTSLQELGRLVGHRLAPGVAAQTHLAFTIERPPPTSTAPAGADPGTSPPVTPDEVTLPVGLRVRSIPGPDEQAQTFETVEACTARPAWNAMPVRRTSPWRSVNGVTSAHLAGAALGLRPGDVLLLASTDLARDRWDVRVLTEATPDAGADVTHVRWTPGLGSFSPPNPPAESPDAFVLRKRLRVFGHQAPMWDTMLESYRADYPEASEDDTDWPGFEDAIAGSGTGATATVTVDLDGAHPEVAVGSWVVLSQDTGGFYRELYEVTRTHELTRAEFGVSGTVTRLTLRGERHDFGTPRQVTVFAVAEPVTLVDGPADSPVTGDTVDVVGDATAMVAGRPVIVRGRTTNGVDTAWVGTLDAQPTASGGHSTLRFTEPLPTAFERGTAVVLGNVALATHGETVSEVLGSGDARHAFPSFALRQGPLTHVQAATDAGSASTLQVRVDDVAWREQPSLFGRGPRERSYTTRDTPDGAVEVVFGDGRTGRRLPTGSLNVRATYRTGSGSAGNVRPEQLALPMDRPLGLKAVANPLPATGGVDPDTEQDARRTIPLPVRTLGRAVSLRDYADFALAFAGIGLADATVLTPPEGRTIVVTVTDPDRAPAPAATVTNLTTALRDRGDPHVRVRVLPASAASFRLAAKVVVHPDHDREVVLAAVATAATASFAAAARGLAQHVHLSDVVATLAGVPGVVGVDLDRLHRDDQTVGLHSRLVARPARLGPAGAVLAAELLALDTDPFTWLLATS